MLWLLKIQKELGMVGESYGDMLQGVAFFVNMQHAGVRLPLFIFSKG